MPMPETPTDQERDPWSAGVTAYLMGEPLASNPHATREEGSPGFRWSEGWKAERQSQAEAAADVAYNEVMADPDATEADMQRALAEEEAQPKPKLAIILEGGLVQCVISDRPELFAGFDVCVIDYDSEGADDDEIFLVRQGDGSREEACVGHHEVTLAGIDLHDIEPKADALKSLEDEG